MALTNNTLPAIIPQFALPLDANMQFAAAQSLTATGYINNLNAVVDLGLGRFVGVLAVDLSVLDQTTGDETYKMFLLGSNDVAFGNGNCDVLAGYDWGAAANRAVPTISGANFAGIPATNLAGTIFEFPFTNKKGGFVFRYSKLYLIAAGTTPIFTVASAWIAPIEMKV